MSRGRITKFIKNLSILEWGVIGAIVVVLSALGLTDSVGHGNHSLFVVIENRDADAIRVVKCKLVPRYATAAEVLTDAKEDNVRWRTVVEPFDGKPISTSVPIYYRKRTWFGIKLIDEFSQTEKLLLSAEYQDGRHLEKVVPIPDVRHSDSVTVVFP